MSFSSVVSSLAPYAWYRCNEVSGSILTDSSGNLRVGTIVGSPAFQQTGITTDGNHTIGINANTQLLNLTSGVGQPGNSNAAFTIGFLWKPGTLATTYLASADNGDGTHFWQLIIDTSNGLLLALNTVQISSCSLASAGIVSNGPSQVYWLTYDGSGNWAVYINGSSTAVMSATGSPITTNSTTYSLSIPGYAGTGGSGLTSQGNYQDLMLFNSVINQTNRAAVYSASGISSTSATGYSVNVPTSALATYASSGSVSLVGGTVLTSSLVVTLSDGASGTFSPNPVTIGTGSGSVGFTYTPATAGTRTVAYTHTGGNSGMAGDGSSPVVVTASGSSVFTLLEDYTPSGGPVAASANPGSIGNGFTDITGNYWSIDSSNIMHSILNTNATGWNTGVLARLASADASINSQIRIIFTATAHQTINAISRFSSSGGLSSGYEAEHNQGNGILAIYSIVNGVRTSISATSSPITLTAGTDYELELITYQVDPTTTNVFAQINTNTGTYIGGLNSDDTTAALQNISSGQALYGAGLSGASPISVKRVRTYSAPAMAVYFDYTPTGGPIAASATPGSIGNGFTDVTGNYWSIDTTNALRSILNVNTKPWNFGVLARTGAGSVLQDAQTVIRFTNQLVESTYMMHRLSFSGSDATAYIAGYSQSSNQLLIYRIDAGVLSSALVTTSIALANGSDYDLTFVSVQLDAYSTLLHAYIADVLGNVQGHATVTDASSDLLSVAGGQGLFAVSTTTSPQGITVKRYRAFTDIGTAIGYAVNLSQYGYTGVPVTGSISLIGGTGLTAPLVVTLSDGAGGTFTPSSVTITAANATASFTYSSPTNGTKTVSWTHTGGNTVMSGDGSQSFSTAAPVTIATNSTACVSSPYNQQQGSGGAGTLKTWNPGAYWRFYVTGCLSANILFDTASTGATWYYCIDEGPLQGPNTVVSSFTVLIPDRGSHVIRIMAETTVQPIRWNNTHYFGLNGVTLGPGGTADTGHVVKGTLNLLYYGDSITEGDFANDGLQSNSRDYSYLVGESLRQLGFEYGNCSCSGQGYTIFGAGAGNVPPLYTIGNDTNSAWNKISLSASRLDVNGKITPVPNIIFEAMGTNDGLSGTTGLPLQQQITAFLFALRAAAPNALIIMQIPFGGFIRADKLAAIATYQATANDTKLVVSDLKIDSRLGPNPGQYCTLGTGNGGVHPNVWGHANIGSLVMEKIQAAYNTATGGGGGGPSGPTPFFPSPTVF